MVQTVSRCLKNVYCLVLNSLEYSRLGVHAGHPAAIWRCQRNRRKAMLVRHTLAIGAAPTNADAAPAFYRIRDVMRITALSRSTVYRRIAEGRFPAPFNLGGRASAWQRAALQAWIDNPEQYCATTPRD